MYLPVVNKSVTVIVPSGKEAGTYTAILNTINTNELILSKPVLSGKHEKTTLPDGLSVIVDYEDDKDVPCRFETVVVEFLDGGQDWMLLKCPDKIERHQRREEYRIPLSRKVDLTYESKEISCVMNDLSGGGCSVWVEDTNDLKLNDMVELHFLLNSKQGINKIQAQAQIVNIQYSDDFSRQSFCSLKFINISEDMRQKILEYIFNRHALDVALNSVGREIMY